MYRAKDGKAFGNHEMGRHYDATRGNAADVGEKEEPEEKDGETEIEDAVKEHGPAEKIEMHTHHEDGHVSKHTHHDKESAHRHVDEAMGERDDEEHGEPDGDEAMGGGESAMPAIPGLRE